MHERWMAGALAGVVLALLAAAGPAAASPCTTATAPCTEWLTMGGGPTRALVYRTHALDVRNERITRAVVMIHGAGRNADGYFRSVLAAAFLAGALEDTVLVAPRFASNDGGACRDALGPDELNWTCPGGPASWRTGGHAIGAGAAVTSFDVADEILRRLARPGVFPALRGIVVAGHSAGGQFVNRYTMAGEAADRLGVPVTYVVANPSSYAYLDALRPTASALPAAIAAAAPGYQPPPAATPPPPFAPYADAASCTAYDRWPYGLQQRAGHAAPLSEERLRAQLVARPTTYLLGELDILPLYQFDASCPAMAQGPTRLARGVAYARYLSERYGATHRTVVVPACGHSARCMFTAEVALRLLFPAP